MRVVLDRTCLLDGHAPALLACSRGKSRGLLRRWGAGWGAQAAGEPRECVGPGGAGYVRWWLLSHWNRASRGWRSGHQGGCGFHRSWLGSQPVLARVPMAPPPGGMRDHDSGLSQLQAPVSSPSPLATASSLTALWVVPSGGGGGGCSLTIGPAVLHPTPAPSARARLAASHSPLPQATSAVHPTPQPCRPFLARPIILGERRGQKA